MSSLSLSLPFREGVFEIGSFPLREGRRLTCVEDDRVLATCARGGLYGPTLGLARGSRSHVEGDEGGG